MDGCRNVTCSGAGRLRLKRGDATCSGAGSSAALGRVEPLSTARVRIEFTADASLCDKLQQGTGDPEPRGPNGDLGALFERALEALLEKETRLRFGTGRPRKKR